LLAEAIRLAVSAHPGLRVRQSAAVIRRVAPAIGLDEGGVQGQRLTFDDATLHELLQEAVHHGFKPLGADAVSEPGKLGWVLGLLVLLDVADLS
jgi:hypothetical protein